MKGDSYSMWWTLKLLFVSITVYLMKITDIIYKYKKLFNHQKSFTIYVYLKIKYYLKVK